MDPSHSALHFYRGNNALVPGSYGGGRPFRPPGDPSIGRRRSGNNGGGDGGALAWNRNYHYPPPPPPPPRRRRNPRRPEEATSRHFDLPYLRTLSEEGVAILDLSVYELGDFSESGDGQIGKVSTTGLSEESIRNCLKTRNYHPEEAAARTYQENDCCVICQEEEYRNGEKIGVLDCGHEYHENCLKKWLLRKNVCPICKAPAITPLNERANF